MWVGQAHKTFFFSVAYQQKCILSSILTTQVPPPTIAPDHAETVAVMSPLLQLH